jgi:hypothetical protein
LKEIEEKRRRGPRRHVYLFPGDIILKNFQQSGWEWGNVDDEDDETDSDDSDDFIDDFNRRCTVDDDDGFVYDYGDYTCYFD